MSKVTFLVFLVNYVVGFTHPIEPMNNIGFSSIGNHESKDLGVPFSIQSQVRDSSNRTGFVAWIMNNVSMPLQTFNQISAIL
jgi:hypothetical protein